MRGKHQRKQPATAPRIRQRSGRKQIIQRPAFTEHVITHDGENTLLHLR